MKNLPAFLLAALSLLALSPSAHAFPELVRRGYANCTTCHVSPTGGGVLTEYGRQLSIEALSWKGTETEAAFVYGLVKPPEWFLGGGDVRWVQTYRDTPTVREGMSIWMQQDFEGAINYDKFTLDGTLGVDNNGDFITRRYYLMYKPTDQTSVRFGKFLPSFGIHMPDHYLEIRRGLEINEDAIPSYAESYNLEAAYIGENLNFYATGDFGRFDNPNLHHEGGFSLQGSYFFADRYKVGFSFYDGTSDIEPYWRQLFGPFGILGFTPHFYLLTEWDFQNRAGIHGGAVFNRLNYEFLQGFIVFFQQELGRYNWSVSATTDEVYGGGLQIFPRPHFEFEIQYQKRREFGAPYMIDYGYLYVHFYL